MLRLHCEQAQLLTDVTLGCGTGGEFELERACIEDFGGFLACNA